MVAEVLEEERERLLPLPVHPFGTDLLQPVRSGKTIYVRFDLNEYSIPHTAVQRPLTLNPSHVIYLDLFRICFGRGHWINSSNFSLATRNASE